jgi:hypothetical protein
MRRSCLECVVKHLGSAAAYIEEVRLGYPNYFGFVYGHLDHAASECLEDVPDLAMAIREHRIKWATTRNTPHPHVIPFEAMFGFIDAMEQASTVIEVPEEVYSGLSRDEAGNVVFSADTRPDAGEDSLSPRKNAVMKNAKDK